MDCRPHSIIYDIQRGLFAIIWIVVYFKDQEIDFMADINDLLFIIIKCKINIDIIPSY